MRLLKDMKWFEENAYKDGNTFYPSSKDKAKLIHIRDYEILEDYQGSRGYDGMWKIGIRSVEDIQWGLNPEWIEAHPQYFI